MRRRNRQTVSSSILLLNHLKLIFLVKFCLFKHDKLLLFDTLKDRIESDINQVEENRRLLYLEIKRHELLENENVSESNGYHQTPAPGASSSINLKRKLPKKLSTENENDRKKKSIAVTDILLKTLKLNPNSRFIRLNSLSTSLYCVFSLRFRYSRRLACH